MRRAMGVDSAAVAEGRRRVRPCTSVRGPLCTVFDLGDAEQRLGVRVLTEADCDAIGPRSEDGLDLNTLG